MAGLEGKILEVNLSTGSSGCRWIIHLKPPAITTGGDDESSKRSI